MKEIAFPGMGEGRERERLVPPALVFVVRPAHRFCCMFRAPAPLACLPRYPTAS